MNEEMPIPEVAVPGPICWSCEYLDFSSGEPHYSDDTPGSDFRLECGKGYWEFRNCDDGLDEFREKLQSASKCGSFEQRVPSFWEIRDQEMGEAREREDQAENTSEL